MDMQLELLRSAHVIYIDATFRVVPSFYHQLFTWLSHLPHSHSDDHAFVLTSYKT